MQDCNAIYRQWLQSVSDGALLDELKSIEGDQEAITDRFYRELEFGTGGLRGVIGAGTNRMNVYTVRKATQGLANYLIQTG
ncbi:MAG: phospho-sugar mutase, partial [Firmicutes bacterium]|nr:phospho-sugar mutase [Bacillota bacterium]